MAETLQAVEIDPQNNDQKTVQSSRHIELMEWLPTLPQLFAYLGFTQAVIMFWVFVAECANDMVPTRDWVLVMMWITIAITTVAFGVYTWFLKFNVAKMLCRTVSSFLAFVFIFYGPTLMHGNTVAAKAIVALIKVIITVIVTLFYSAVYLDDIAPPANHLPRPIRRIIYR